MIRRRSILAAGMATAIMAALAQIAACRSTSPTEGPESSSIVASGESFAQPVNSVTVNQNYGSGSRFEMVVDGSRDIDQIQISWDAHYTVVKRDSAGRVLLNDEGQPLFRDGIYAFPKISNSLGNLQNIGTKKFVGASETDNIHDLQGVRGSRLVIEFWHDRLEQERADVREVRRTILLRTVTVRYKDAPGQRYKDYILNPNYNDALSPLAKYILDGQTFELPVPRSYSLYRIDVRWGDAKPRVNGVYVAGVATGKLKVNGQWQGEARNVAAIETQTWTGLNIPPANGPNHTIVVSIRNDAARIHSIRVYF